MDWKAVRQRTLFLEIYFDGSSQIKKKKTDNEDSQGLGPKSGSCRLSMICGHSLICVALFNDAVLEKLIV